MANTIGATTNTHESVQAQNSDSPKNSSKSLSNAKPPAPQDKLTISSQARAAQAANKSQSNGKSGKRK